MLLDTSGLFALCNQAEPDHQAAGELQALALRQLTHSVALAEFIALSHARRFPRPLAIRFALGVLRSPDIDIIWVGEELTERGIELLRKRPDKTYSLCDAISFLLMRDYDIHEALTTDRHFDQEGFRRLLPVN